MIQEAVNLALEVVQQCAPFAVVWGAVTLIWRFCLRAIFGGKL